METGRSSIFGEGLLLCLEDEVDRLRGENSKLQEILLNLVLKQRAAIRAMRRLGESESYIIMWENDVAVLLMEAPVLCRDAFKEYGNR